MPPAPDFRAYSTDHLTALGLIALLAGVVSVALRRTCPDADGRRTIAGAGRSICAAIAGALLIYWFGWQIQRAATGTWTVQDSVPLHLCDLAVLMTAAALGLQCGERTRDGFAAMLAFELSFYWTFGGTTQALLTPDLRYGFPHFQFVKFFVGHGLSLLGVLSLAVGLRLRPRPWSALRVWGLTAALVPPVMLFNWLTGSNYMYLCGPPTKASLFDYFGRWPVSVAVLILAAGVIMHICYAPYWIAGLARARRAARRGPASA